MGQVHKRLDPRETGQEAGSLHAELRKRIVGQNEAIDQIVNVYQTYLAGLTSPGRPIGSFLFLGPTGSGKTRLVEATAEALVNDLHAVIKIDCAEFQHSHEIAKLIGSPPGYLGHRETHPLLSQEVLNQHHTEKIKISFVLFDEIEKASDSLWNLLLGILDKATLTLGDNRRVDFSRSMIFMTSNLGAAEMNALIRPRLGFQCHGGELPKEGATLQQTLGSKITRSAVEAARRKFTPEFMNRLDKIVVFQPLCSSELEKILEIELQMLQHRVFHTPSSTPFVFHLTPAAKDFLLREGTDMKYGARHLKRAMERELVHPLSNLVASQQIKSGDLLQVDFDGEARCLDFTKEAEDVPVCAMAQMIDKGSWASVIGKEAVSEPQTTKTANAKTSRQ